MLQRLRRPITRSCLLLAVGLLSAALALVVLPQGPVATAAPAAAAAPEDPTDDHFNMPAACPQPGKIIPQRHEGCRLTKFYRNRPTVVLWGDSHAWQHLPALAPLAKMYRVNLTAFVLGGCPPVHWPYKGGDPKRFQDSKGRLRNCHWSNALALRYVKRMAARRPAFQLIIGSHWAGFRDHYKRIFRQGQTPTCDEAKPYVMEMSRLAHSRTNKLFRTLDRKNIRTVATSQTATVPPLRNAGPCAERDDPYTGRLKRKASIQDEGRTRTWLLNRMKGIPGPDLVDVNGAFCGRTWCRGMVDGIYTWYDDLHISRTRMRHSYKHWQPFFKRLDRLR